MQEAVAKLQSALDEVKPHLDTLSDLDSQIAAAKQSLATVEAQIELRQRTLAGVQAEIEQKRAAAQKLQRDEIEARQVKLQGLINDINVAEAELKDLQTKTHAEHERWQGLARKANKLEQSLG